MLSCLVGMRCMLEIWYEWDDTLRYAKSLLLTLSCNQHTKTKRKRNKLSSDLTKGNGPSNRKQHALAFALAIKSIESSKTTASDTRNTTNHIRTIINGVIITNPWNTQPHPRDNVVALISVVNGKAEFVRSIVSNLPPSPSPFCVAQPIHPVST